jgi:hypothetical protein
MITVELDLKNIPTDVLLEELCHRMQNSFELRQEKWNDFIFNGESYALKIINLNEANRKE